jgi:hypothetical protein
VTCDVGAGAEAIEDSRSFYVNVPILAARLDIGGFSEVEKRHYICENAVKTALRQAVSVHIGQTWEATVGA